jgi:hypothetical protein
MKTHSNLIQKTFLFLLVFSFITCKKKADEPIQDAPIYLESAWKKEGFPGKLIGLSKAGHLVVAENDNAVGQFRLLDAQTGAPLWVWKELDGGDKNILLESAQISNDLLLFNGSENRTYAVNLMTGKTVWKHHFVNKESNDYLFKDNKDNIYRVVFEPNKKYSQSIVRTNIYRPEWEEICVFQDTSQTLDNMEISNVMYLAHAGKESLLFTLSNGNSSPVIAMYFGYDLKAKIYRAWTGQTNYLTGFVPNKNLIIEGMAYVLGSEPRGEVLMAMDMDEGSFKFLKLLRKTGYNLFQNFNVVVVALGAKDSLGSASLQSFDYANGTSTGNHEFNGQFKPDFLFNRSNAVKEENFIFSTQCKSVVAININNLTPTLEMFFTDNSICANAAPIINREKRLLFVQSGNFIHAVKVPNSVNF